MRPKPSLVVAWIALLAALGGTAFAAVKIDSGDIKNGSLKSADLKNNAGAKGVDVVNGSVAGADVRDGSLAGSAIAEDSITGADVNEAALTVSRLVARLGGDSGVAIPSGGGPLVVPNLTYTQAADSTDRYIAGGTVTFAASCTAPRSVSGLLLIDGLVPSIDTIAGSFLISDNGAGAVTRSFSVGGSVAVGAPGLSQFRRGAPAPHALVFYGGSSCSAGAGVTLSSAGVDVVSNR